MNLTEKYMCLFEFISYISSRSNFNDIIYLDIENNIDLSLFSADDINLTILTEKKNFDSFKNLPFKVLDINEQIPVGIVENSIVLINVVLKNIENIKKLSKTLKFYNDNARYFILSIQIDECSTSNMISPHEAFSLNNFFKELKSYGIEYTFNGYAYENSVHSDKNVIILIGGTETKIKNVQKVSCLAIISTFNEEDMIIETVEHLLKQGIDVHVMDNWSNDNTYEVLKKHYHKNNRVKISRFPDEKHDDDQYHWHDLLKEKERIAKNSNYDWIIHHDADEIRLTPWDEVKLIDGISWVDYLGYNAIDFFELVFRFTDENDNVYKDFESNLRDFEFGRRDGHFLRINCWKNNEEICLAKTGGHSCDFVHRKVFPLKFLMKHYPLRNKEHAFVKIFKDRLPRFESEKKEFGWHGHYDKHTKEKIKVWKDYDLIHYNKCSFNQRYLIERLSCVGIIRDNSSAVDECIIYKEEIKKLKKSLKKERKLVDKIQKSSSWKITKPIRKIRNLIKNW